MNESYWKPGDPVRISEAYPVRPEFRGAHGKIDRTGVALGPRAEVIDAAWVVMRDGPFPGCVLTIEPKWLEENVPESGIRLRRKR